MEEPLRTNPFRITTTLSINTLRSFTTRKVRISRQSLRLSRLRTPAEIALSASTLTAIGLRVTIQCQSLTSFMGPFNHQIMVRGAKIPSSWERTRRWLKLTCLKTVSFDSSIQLFHFSIKPPASVHIVIYFDAPLLNSHSSRKQSAYI